jgi:hypothetical protein
MYVYLCKAEKRAAFSCLGVLARLPVYTSNVLINCSKSLWYFMQIKTSHLRAMNFAILLPFSVLRSVEK